MTDCVTTEALGDEPIRGWDTERGHTVLNSTAQRRDGILSNVSGDSPKNEYKGKRKREMLSLICICIINSEIKRVMSPGHKKRTREAMLSQKYVKINPKYKDLIVGVVIQQPGIKASFFSPNNYLISINEG